ncbi:MAG: DUF58 domain-containing protein [Deltaproteobacteria bacterium]|nr:DUF58 domain-containing protein [Deltaproteobacteria bacterium]
MLERIRKIEIVTSRKVNDQLAGQYHSVFKGRGMSFDEVRPYQPGDEIRFIDWNVTARSTEPFVKRFVEERELTVMLLVDASASLAFGSNAQLKREVAAELSALLAFSAVKNNDRVGMIMFSDRIEHYVPPKKGKKHVLRLVSDVLGFRAQGSRTDLAEALRYMSRAASRKTICFVISDFQAPAASFEHALRVVARRHDVVPVIIRDVMESELPDLGLVLGHDLETGTEVWIDTSSRRVRERYRARVKDERRQLTELFRRMKIDGIEVETGGSYVKALVQFFELRARRL